MKKSAIILVGVAVAAMLLASEAFSRGGGGGGRGGGGGGARAGGGGGARAGGGGGARPSPSPAINRSPSMSRAAPSINRPAAASRPAAPSVAQRPSAGGGGAAANRPSAGQRPSAGAGQGIAANRPAQLPAGGSQAGQRPSQGQLNNFLNMPADSGRGQLAGSAARPAQLPSKGGSLGNTVTGPRGGQITAGGASGIRAGAGGAAIGAGIGAVKITGPGGNSYTKVAGGAAIRGPGGNAIAAGRGASFANGQFVGGRSWAAVNGNFNRWGCFTPGWYGRYPGAWWPGKWAVAATAWTAATWATAGSYCGCSGEGIYYDYSENVTYDDGNVYYGDQPVASAEQYYDQAAQIADDGQLPQNGEWMPLGVFAVITESDQTTSDKVVQLAINKDGVIRGNLQDALTDKVTLVGGAVDKKTQRVALKLEDNASVVVETGLYNLTNDEVPVLIHLDADHTESRTLIRLQQPES